MCTTSLANVLSFWTLGTFPWWIFSLFFPQLPLLPAWNFLLQAEHRALPQRYGMTTEKSIIFELSVILHVKIPLLIFCAYMQYVSTAYLNTTSCTSVSVTPRLCKSTFMKWGVSCPGAFGPDPPLREKLRWIWTKQRISHIIITATENTYTDSSSLFNISKNIINPGSEHKVSIYDWMWEKIKTTTLCWQ